MGETLKLVDKNPFLRKTRCKTRGLDIACWLNAAAISAFWTWFVSHGFTVDRILDGVYEIQASALLAGRLSIEPGPLQAFYHDALMFWGEYYFYWGLLPSGLFVALSSVIGVAAGHYVVVFAFVLCLIHFFQKILWQVMEAAVGADSLRAVMLPGLPLVWVLIFAIPYPTELGWFFGRFAIYEQQVIFGLALGMPGVYLLIRAARQASLTSLAGAGLVFFVASWTRVTWFPLAGICIALAMVFWVAALFKGRRSWSGGFVALMCLAVLVLAGLMLVNYVRFESPFDFGVRYQNPAHYLYFRNSRMFFSPLTRFWNTLFDMASYFIPAGWVQASGLASRAFAYYEGVPPSFLGLNPQFILLLVLCPVAIYRAVGMGGRVLVPFAVLAALVVYLNILIGLFGTFVILRYFVEFYYFLAVFFLCILVMLTRPGIAIIGLALMLCLHIPGTVRNFASFYPELRTADPRSLRVTSVDGVTPFIERGPLWPAGSLSASDLGRIPPYAVMGVEAAGSEMAGKDILAVYMVPAVREGNAGSAFLKIAGLRSTSRPVTARVFIENRQVDTLPISPDKPKDAVIQLPFDLQEGPYQVMIVFLPEGLDYLPARTSGESVVVFREIRLNR